MYLRFDQRSWIGIRFLIQRRQLDGNDNCGQKYQYTPSNASPKSILQAKKLI